ncbi:MAG TPA: LacI family DNA-binding transcriptional regulator [Candidatus Limnocylindria bacterium]|nr:LacI family DNA-binding transcriptional regulator [Candidatus Limnocylindria bacterium]
MTVGEVERPGWRKGVTLRDVASDSGVSVTTVSRILNGRESGIPIRAETRTRVLEAAARLGYTPNLLARGLRGSRSSLLGVIARDISDPFHLQVLRGINEVARAREYRLFLGHVDYRAEVAIAYGSMFERSHADGIIVIGDLEGGDPALDILSQQHRYVVGVTDRTGRRQVPGVYGDSVSGSMLAMEHLWSLGHRSIVCVSDARTYDGRRRIEVYREFMERHGAAEHIAVHITDPEPAPSYELGTRLFSDGAMGGASALYATSDTTAFGLMKAAFEAGIAIPDQLSIVGYDDIDLAAYTIPPLTTISQSGVEMGRLAGDLLFDMITRQAQREDVADVVLTPKLVARQSTAAAGR